MTTAIQIVYASAPTTEVIIPSLMIEAPGKTPIRICSGFEDQLLGVNGTYLLFEAGSLSIALPKKDTSGQQTLSFGVANVNGVVQMNVDDALESDDIVTLTYAEYLASDKSAPAKRPHIMTLKGGVLEGGEARFGASYFDLLNTAWSRERYTAETAPGIRYL